MNDRTNELLELGSLNSQRHPSSILLRWTYDLQVLYTILRCGVPEHIAPDLPCPRPVIGVVGHYAFCLKHDMSDSELMLYANPHMERIYRQLSCSIPEAGYNDCRNRVMGVFKDVAFCKQHAWYAHERRYSYPWQMN